MNHFLSQTPSCPCRKKALLLGAGWLVLGILVCIRLTKVCPFLYAYIEQFRLFQENADFALRCWSRPGGPLEYVTTFLLQFFVYPGVGAMATVLLWAASALGLRAVCRRLMPQHEAPVLYLLPGLLAVWASFDFNYHWESTGALVLISWFWVGYIQVKHPWFRWVTGVLGAWLLFYLTGPAWLAAWMGLLLYEWLTDSRIKVALLGATFLVGLPAVGWYLTGQAGEFRMAFLPDAYTHSLLPVPPLLYVLWLSLPGVVCLAGVGRRGIPWVRPAVRYGSGVAQVLLVMGGLQWGLQQYLSSSWREVHELDYYARHQQWESLLAYPLRSGQNSLHAAYQNLALAHTGRLADHLLRYSQVGVEGLCPTWNRSTTVSTLLSDIYYAMGQIGLSQRMAFEGMVSSERAVNPRLLLRLVQTNLILGHPEVAQRYVRLLEQTSTYGKQAAFFRNLLDNEASVEQDPELGPRRRFLQGVSGLTNLSTVPSDLLQQVQLHPEAAVPFDYVCAYCLLAKDVATLQRLLESVPGKPAAEVNAPAANADAVPVTVSAAVQQVRPLPVPVQEALLMLHENESSSWTSLGISQAVIDRFQGFRRTWIAHKGSSGLAAQLRAGYGQTFWYYYLFHK